MKTKIKKNEKEKFSLKKELNENFKIKNEKIKPKLHKENFFDDNCFQTKNNPINSKIEFITTDIDKYLKCDNRSQSITIHNLANSFDANNNSRLIDSMINTKASNLNQNSSYSKVNNTIKKRLIFGQINDEEKNNNDSRRNSIILNFNTTNNPSIKQSKNDLPNPNVNNIIMKLKGMDRSGANLSLANEQALNNNNLTISQLKDSFKASIVSLPNNNGNNSNINLDLSQSQILNNQPDVSNNNLLAYSPLNVDLTNQIKSSDVTLSINQNTNNYRRFTNTYNMIQIEKAKLDIVNNVNEYYYLKPYAREENFIDYLSENADTDEFTDQGPNKVYNLEVKENNFENDRDMINFNLLVNKFYPNQSDNHKVRLLENELTSIQRNMTKLNKLKRDHKELSSKLNNMKRSYDINEESMKEQDSDSLIIKKIQTYQKISKDKFDKYKILLLKLNVLLKETHNNSKTNLSCINDFESLDRKFRNNFISFIKSTNPLPPIKDDETNEIKNLVKMFNDLNPEDFKFEIPSIYQDKLNRMILIDTKIIKNKKINIYTNQISETFYSNGTVKRSFDDGYFIYYFENGDIKQVFPDKTYYYFYALNNIFEYNYEKLRDYKIIIKDDCLFVQIHSNGVKLSKEINSDKVKVTKNIDDITEIHLNRSKY